MTTHRPYLRAVIGLLFVVVLVTAVAPRLTAQGQLSRRDRSPAQTTLMPNYGLRARVDDFAADTIADVLVDPARDRLYVADYTEPYIETGPTLHVIDTAQGQFIESIDGPDIEQLALSADGTRLIAYSPFYPADPGSFRVYNADTLDLIDEFPIDCDPATVDCGVGDMAAGPDGRLYWIAYSDWRVSILDPATGATLSRLELTEEDAIQAIEIAGDKLFIGKTSTSSDPELQRYDVSAVEPVFELAAPVDFSTFYLAVAPDGSFLVASNTVQVDAETLTTIRTLENDLIQPPSSAAIALDSEQIDIFIDLLNEDRPFFGIDAATGETVITGMVDMSDNPYPGLGERIVALPGDEVAVVMTNSIYIYHATQYAAAVPVILETFCGGGPVVDDFSNPNSGWPSDTLEGIVVGYIDGEYTIMQQAADSWFAVSRGDRWANARLASITTRLPARMGYSGLVFGLNNDWSHFYTFEVIPAQGSTMGRWIVFDYTEGVGWTLLLTNVHSNITGLGGWNKVELGSGSAPDKTALLVNGAIVGEVGNVPGRVGLSAGSFETDFEARFDNYVFLGENCYIPGRSEEIDAAPILSRPSLESFLGR